MQKGFFQIQNTLGVNTNISKPYYLWQKTLYKTQFNKSGMIWNAEMDFLCLLLSPHFCIEDRFFQNYDMDFLYLLFSPNFCIEYRTFRNYDKECLFFQEKYSWQKILNKVPWNGAILPISKSYWIYYGIQTTAILYHWFFKLAQ